MSTPHNGLQAFNTKKYSLVINRSSERPGKVPVSNLRIVEKDGSLYREVVKISDDSLVDVAASTYLEGSQHFRIPSAVKTKSGRTVAVYDVRWDHIYDIAKGIYNDLVIAASYTKKDGTWTDPQCIIDWVMQSEEDGQTYYQSGAADPGIIYDEKNNIIFVFAICGKGFGGTQSVPVSDDVPYSSARRQQLVMTYSLDEGETWSTPTSVSDKIYDSAGGETPENQTWGNTYAYLFSCCSAGFVTRNQKNKKYNGKLYLPVQLHVSEAVDAQSRSALLQITPIVKKGKVDVKLNLVNITTGLIGEINKGADEGQCCEGPNGEFVFVVKSYDSNAYSSYQYGTAAETSSDIGKQGRYMYMIRLYKSTDMGKTWNIIGDVDVHSINKACNKDDLVCSSIISSDRVKPSLTYSTALKSYVLGCQLSLYRNATSSAIDIRNNTVLFYSEDLIDWKILDHVENSHNVGYSTFVQQKPTDTDLEVIVESFDDIVNKDTTSQVNVDGGVQFKVYSFGFFGETNEYSNSSKQPLIVSSSNTNISGIKFKTSDFSNDGFMNVSSVSFRGGHGNSQNIFAVLYQDGYFVAATDIINARPSHTHTFEFQRASVTANDEIEYVAAPVLLTPNHEYAIAIYSNQIASSKKRDEIIREALVENHASSASPQFTEFGTSYLSVIAYYCHQPGNLAMYNGSGVINGKIALVSFNAHDTEQTPEPQPGGGSFYPY